jgi:glyoxylase-like metal-dependent hydrolase (beta-lactamase superfamily II)
MTIARHMFAVGLAVSLVGAASLGSAQEPTREITNIAGDLYRFQNNFHFSVFYVTDEGIIATDPINADAAEWLKAELQTRFNQPVKFLIYSHDHADHISGGEVFADTAMVVAHAQAKADIIGEQRPTAVPNITVEDALTIELGGKTVELSFVGRNHSDNSLVMHFPAERTLFAVDFIPVKQVAFRDFGDAYVEEWIDSLKAVEAMDFDTLAPGHGPIGEKSDVTAFREYMEDLHSQVLAAVRAGMTVEETQAAVDLSKYADWGQFEEWGPLNIAGMHRRISLNRVGNPS